MRHFLIRRLLVAAATIGVLGGVVALPAASQSASQPAVDAPVPAGRMLVLEIQQHLSALGLDPGPVDGLLGEQTRQTIRAFEQEEGLAVTGEPAPEILRHLRQRVAAERNADPREASAGTEPAPVAAESEPAGQRAVKPVPIAEATSESTLAGTTWLFRDDSGVEFSVRFEPDGAISGPVFSRGWTWEQEAEQVKLTYDNRVGGQATRSGELISGHEMAGRGESSRGAEWFWQASRTR